MNQSIPSVTTPSSLRATPEQLTKIHAHINCPGGRGWEVAKFKHTGMFSTQHRFFCIHTEHETDFAFSFKNSEVQ